MNITDYEAEVISSAVDYFIKHDVSGITTQRKSELNNSALEAISLINSHADNIGIKHVQAVDSALVLYISFLKQSLLANPKALSTAECLADKFAAYLEPFLMD